MKMNALCRTFILKGDECIMSYIEGEDRYQINLLPNPLDDFVDEENPVRVIDAYVDSLKLEELGFQVFSGTKAGQRPYRREDLLKLYLYCYINGVRSSRKIETETKRNIELMWLIGKLQPDHGTISAFMKNYKCQVNYVQSFLRCIFFSKKK